MSIDERSNASVMVSMAAGLVFTMAGASLAAFLVYCMADELTGLHSVRMINLGIIGLALAVAVYWACAGLNWIAEDIAEALQRVALRT